MKKITALALTVLITANAYAQTISAVAPAAVEGSVFMAEYEKFIPADLGKLYDGFYSGSGKTVINIQDLHADAAAQKRIYDILEYLNRNYEIEKIYLEGAIGDIDFGWIKAVSGDQARSGLEDALFEAGKITGGELFGMRNPDVSFSGLEKDDVYINNFHILGLMFENAAKLRSMTDTAEARLEEQSGRLLSRQNKKFDGFIKKYAAGKISDEKYYGQLFEFGKKAGLKTYEYKNISKYLALSSEGEKVNFQKVRQQLAGADKIMKENLPYGKYKKISENAELSPSEYYRNVGLFLREKGLEDGYKELFSFFEFTNSRAALNVAGMVKEEDEVKKRIYESNAENVRESDHIFLKIYAGKLKSFFSNSIMSEDYEYIKSNYRRFGILMGNYMQPGEIKEIDSWYKTVSAYYEGNVERNKHFLEKILQSSVMSAGKSEDSFIVRNHSGVDFGKIIKEENNKISVMITGGFHSEGLIELMSGNNVNYAVITPSLENADLKASGEKFYSEFKKRRGVFESAYQVFIRSAIFNVAWSDPAAVIASNFLDYEILRAVCGNVSGESSFAKEGAAEINQYLERILRDKKYDGKSITAESISQDAEGGYVLALKENNAAPRMFRVTKENVSELKAESAAAVNESAKKDAKGYAGRFARIIKNIFMMPLMLTMGGGAAAGSGKNKKDAGSVIEENAAVVTEGNVTLKDSFVGDGRSFKVKAGPQTKIIVKGLNSADTGDIDVTIEDAGTYEIVYEEGALRARKVLFTDFTNKNKKEKIEVAISKANKINIVSEKEWNSKQRSDVFVYVKRSGYFDHGEESEIDKQRNALLYPDQKVIAPGELLKTGIFGRKIEEQDIERFVQRNGLEGRDLILDMTFAGDKKEAGNLIKALSKICSSITIVKTNVDFDKFGDYDEMYYKNQDGSLKRYPYKDSQWLKGEMSKYFPKFESKTFLMIWPVESTKLTYDSKIREPHPEESKGAYEDFNKFMKMASDYKSKGYDVVVFIPSYLRGELNVYYGKSEGRITDRLVQFSYSNYEEPLKISMTSDRYAYGPKIMVAKTDDDMTLVEYNEGNRGHNEQAYLETLVHTYNFGKGSLDRMLTDAGFPWKANTINVYQGKEYNEENLDVEAELMKNPSIKKGRVMPIYDILKRFFVYIYNNAGSVFKDIFPMYAKGNWVEVFDGTVNEEAVEVLKERLQVISNMGFKTSFVAPVSKSSFDPESYELFRSIDINGQKADIYKYEHEGNFIYFADLDGVSGAWKTEVLKYVKSVLEEYKNDIVVFDGDPGASYREVRGALGGGFVPVVIVDASQKKENEAKMSELGFATVVERSVAANRSQGFKYPHVAEDTRHIAEAVRVVKALKSKSFLGLEKFRREKGSFVGVKIASDEHIFNNADEEQEFLQITKDLDIDFVTVVIRDNDLGAKVLGRATTVGENLKKLAKQLHSENKSMIMEYTFSFIDDHFDTFVREFGENLKEIKFDGLKLDLGDCSAEDIKKALPGLKSIKDTLVKRYLSVQVSNSVWKDMSKELRNAGISRTVSSKDTLLLGNETVETGEDANYEISIYKDQGEYEARKTFVERRQDDLRDKAEMRGAEALSKSDREYMEKKSTEVLDSMIEVKLKSLVQNAIKNSKITKVTLPVNLIYAERLKGEKSVNANVISAVAGIMRFFKEAKGINERQKNAYEFGKSFEADLTDKQIDDIRAILRLESFDSAANYVRKTFPEVFNYFVESRETRIAVSQAFLLGIYENYVIQKYKEGYYGKVYELGSRDKYYETEEDYEAAKTLLNRLITYMALYSDKINLKDRESFFDLNAEDFEMFEEGHPLSESLKERIENFKEGRMNIGSYYYIPEFSDISRFFGDFDHDIESMLNAVKVSAGIIAAFHRVKEIEPVKPVIKNTEISAEDITKAVNGDTCRKLLAAA